METSFQSADLISVGNAGGNHSALDLAAGRPTHTKDALELLEAAWIR